MAGISCPQCSEVNPPGSRYCRACGVRLASMDGRYLLRSRYWPIRFQIDPMDPMPRRDSRWMAIVGGATLLVVGILLLGVSAILAGALSLGGAGCGGTGCGMSDPAIWFEWVSLPLLGAGALLVAFGIWRAFR